jgi:GTP cyclohydrolase I
MPANKGQLMTANNTVHANDLDLIEDRLQAPQFVERFDLNYPPVDLHRLEAAVRNVLLGVCEDVEREGLLNTPRRVARAYDELLSGYRTDPVKLLNNAFFDVEYNDMIIVDNIEFASLCEHHMLPFLGHVHVAYIPRGKVLGLSKIPRVVDMFARRLQLQERMTRQIADFIEEILHPEGVAVLAEGQHMCSMIRGVKKHDSNMTTSTMLGVFRDNPTTRHEFMEHLQRH